MATAESTTNVVPIRKPRPAPELKVTHRTPELAILIAILDSLHDGKKGHRALFERINARVRVLADERPDDPVLSDARGIVTASAWSPRNGR